MSLQQFLDHGRLSCRTDAVKPADCSRNVSSDLEGPVTEACVSARDHTGGDIRWAKPTAANIWDKLAVGDEEHSFVDVVY